MSRINAALLSLLLFLLPAAGALAQSPSLISEDMIKTETVNYSKTALLEKGTFEKRSSGSCTEYYPYTYTLRCDVSGAKFVKFNVNRKQKVKAGDVLAVLSLETDEVTLASRRMELKNTQESYERQKLEKQEAIEEMLERLSQTKERYEREIQTLQIQRAQLAMEQYCYQQECLIDDLQEVITEMEEEIQQTMIISPVDGMVTDLFFKRSGDRVNKGDNLITVSSTEGMLLRLKDNNGRFRYGMPVEISFGPLKSRRVVTGRVVGEDSMLPAERQNGYAYIRMDPYEEDKTRFVQPSVSANEWFLDGVICINRRAAVLDSGKHYVSKLEDGIVRKRYINIAMQSNTQLWVLQGLEEGETIIID